jgi:hypothetical protein
MPQSGRRPAEHLFDADEDPSELENLLGQKPEDAAALRALAAEYLARTPPWSTPETLELNELQLNQLRALGYSLP